MKKNIPLTDELYGHTKPAVSVFIECYLPDFIEMLADYESEDTDFDYDDYARKIVKKTKDWLKDIIDAPIIVEEDGDGYVFSGDYNYSLDNLVFSLKLDNDDDDIESVAFHAVKRMLEEDGAYASFLECIKRITTSRAGYIPRFGMEEVLRTPSLFIRYAIQFAFNHNIECVCEYILS